MAAPFFFFFFFLRFKLTSPYLFMCGRNCTFWCTIPFVFVLSICQLWGIHWQWIFIAWSYLYEMAETPCKESEVSSLSVFVNQVSSLIMISMWAFRCHSCSHLLVPFFILLRCFLCLGLWKLPENCDIWYSNALRCLLQMFKQLAVISTTLYTHRSVLLSFKLCDAWQASARCDMFQLALCIMGTWQAMGSQPNGKKFQFEVMYLDPSILVAQLCLRTFLMTLV